MTFVWPTSHVGMMHPLSANSVARERAQDFLHLATASLEGVSYEQAKNLLKCSHQQAETRKSLFEEMGLLYVPYRSNRIELTPVGRQFITLVGPKVKSSVDMATAQRIDTLLIWALIHSQIHRPTSRGSPRLSDEELQDCDLRPYATVWKLMIDLGGGLFLHEFMGAIRYLQHVADYDSLLVRIKWQRQEGRPFISSSQLEGRGPLMNPRIYWTSHISGALKILHYDSEQQLFTMPDRIKSIIENILTLEQGGEKNNLYPLSAHAWTDVNDYFRVAGAACPDVILHNEEEKASTKTPWTDMERAEITKEYFSMLSAERRGEKYNEVEQRQTLARRIKRSHDAIEAEYQNISAVLDTLDLPAVKGHKPVLNYQDDIVGVLEPYIEDLSQSNAPFACPTSYRAEDIFVMPPETQPRKPSTSSKVIRLARKIDQAQRDSRNRELGILGEEYVLELERRRSDLSPDSLRRIRWTSREDGDGLGYDIHSFSSDGSDLFIEVKTTCGNIRTPFFISENERSAAEEFGNRYQIYRVFNYGLSPKIFKLISPFTACLLTPISYRVTF